MELPGAPPPGLKKMDIEKTALGFDGPNDAQNPGS